MIVSARPGGGSPGHDLTIWLLPLAVLLGAVLRFHDLSLRGLLYWDEGKFALEGIRLLSAGQSLIHLHAGTLAGKAVGTAKPTHALLIALAYAVFGVRDSVPLFLNAAASVLQIGVVYLLGRRLFGPLTALLASLFLAVSEYDVIYARSALSESDADLFFTAGVLLWSFAWHAIEFGRWRPAGRRILTRLGAALLFGIAFTVNYRLSVYIAVVLILDLGFLLRYAGWRKAAGAGVAWLAGLAVLPLAWELTGIAAATHGAILFRSEISYRPTSYLSEVLYQIHGGRQGIMHFNPLRYVQWYLVRQGWPVFLLLIGGCALAAYRRSFPWLVSAALVLGPYLVYIMAPFIVPRNLDATLPFGAVLAAATLTALTGAIRSLPLRNALLVASALVVTLLGSALCWRLGAERSGFARAAAYLHRAGNGRAVVGNEVMIFYLRGPGTSCRAARLPHSFSTLAAAYAAGYRYAEIEVYDTPLKHALLRRGRRLARYLAAGTTSLGENPIASENGSPPGTHLGQHVDVYALAGLHLPPPHGKRIPACTADRLA